MSLQIRVNDGFSISLNRQSPVNDRTISAVVGFGVAPVVTQLVLHGVFIQFDAQARLGGDFDVTFFHLEGLLDVAFSQADLFLAEEVGDGGGDLDACGQRDGPQGVVRGQRGVIGLGHACNDTSLHDATGVAEIGLENAGSAFFQDFAEAPLGEDAFSGRNGEMGAPSDVRHDVYILALDRFFNKKGLIGLQSLDEQLGILGGNGPMKINADIGVLASCFADAGKGFCSGFDVGLGCDDTELIARINPRLEGVEAFGLAGLDGVGVVANMGIDSHSIARGAPQQLIDGHSQGLALDVPQRLLDATQGAGKDWATPVEGVSIEGLPVVDHVARVLADQVRSHFGNGGGTGFGTAFGDGLSQADDALIGVNLEEQPPGLNEQGFEFGDADLGFEGVPFLGMRGNKARIGLVGGFFSAASEVFKAVPTKPAEAKSLARKVRRPWRDICSKERFWLMRRMFWQK